MFWDRVLRIIQLDLSHLKCSILSNYWDWQQDCMDIILSAHGRWELDTSGCSGLCALEEDVNRRNVAYIASPQQPRENRAVLERWQNHGFKSLRKELNKQVLSAQKHSDLLIKCGHSHHISLFLRKWKYLASKGWFKNNMEQSKSCFSEYFTFVKRYVIPYAVSLMKLTWMIILTYFFP